jgi:hypothetical protein
MKEIIISVLISLIATLGFGSFLADKAMDETNVKLDAVIALLQDSSDEDSFGAASGPEMPFRYLSVGGMKTFYNYSGSLIQATSSVICTIQSPAGTSTLDKAGIQLKTGTSTVTSLSATKSTVPYTLGTVLASTTVASGAQKSMDVASSTLSQTAIDDRIFSPNTYLVFSQLGGGVLNQTGSCFASFTQF